MKKPNLLFIFPDQMRGQAMGFLGEEPTITPNLDRFASEALVLNNVVSNYPVCSPYRGMLMTGKYSFSNKVINNCTSLGASHGVELQESDYCWSDFLKDKGYSLGYIGKWHLDSPQEPYIDCLNNAGATKWNEWCPPHRRHGFDFWYSYGTYDYHNKPMYWRGDAKRESFHYVNQWGPEHEADLAIKYLQNANDEYRSPDKPFGLVVAMNPPHMPYEYVPDKYVDAYSDITDEQLSARPNIPPKGTQWGDYYRSNIRNYYAMITGVDDQFGRILKALDDTGLTEDTIVVFTSDHGNCLGIHDCISKSNHYEESMRVPFLIRWPDKIPHQQDDLLMSTPDIYPTLIDLMGFGNEIPGRVEGVSYAQIFMGDNGSKAKSQLGLGLSSYNPASGWRALRTHTHTLVLQSTPNIDAVVLLYDNVSDPYQMQNIAEGNKGLVATLSKELYRWLQKTKDPWIKKKNLSI